MKKSIVTSFFVLVSIIVFGQDNNEQYLANLEHASALYLKKVQIPDSILLKLVPDNDAQFGMYYGTTHPGHKLYETSFFYKTSQRIFEKAVNKKMEDFYLPSLKLISFADGEFAEDFIDYLEQIIEMEPSKFCYTVKGKEYATYNPIKYYVDSLKCR